MTTETSTPALPENVIVREQLDEATNELRREIAANLAQRDTAGDPFSELRQFSNFGEFTQAAYRDKDLADIAHRALTDQITDNNPGVIAPGWISDIKGIIAGTRPTIASFGTEGLPANGMSVEFPYYNGDVTTLVGVQAAEKTAVTSVQVDILRGSEDIATYAGGSDISVQLIERSDPSYLNAYMRIMGIGMSAATEAAMGTAMTAVATAGTAWNPAGGTAGDLRAVLFDASIAIEAATGSPASFVLCASDTFAAIGKLTELEPAPYGVQNVPGTSDAASLNVNVSGLPVRHAQYLAAGTILVSNGSAGSWMETGTRTITAPDVELLGSNVAVYSMGVAVPYLPAGIISIPAV